MNFDNQHYPVGKMDSDWTTEEIKREPSLHSASPAFALTAGGPITREAVRLALVDMDPPIRGQVHVDSRVQMLMKGQYPCIPGWHCDFWKRRDGRIVEPSKDFTYLMHLGSSGSRTSYRTQPDEMADFGSWQDVHREVEGRPGMSYPDGAMVRASPSCLHRGMPAEKNGWRFWIRLSVQDEPILNEVRQHVMVYTTEDKGW